MLLRMKFINISLHAFLALINIFSMTSYIINNKPNHIFENNIYGDELKLMSECYTIFDVHRIRELREYVL